LTNRGKSREGEGCSPGGFCQVPQRAERWTQGTLVPIQCFKLEVVVHQSPDAGPWCLAVEVSDPHTKELFAKWVDPSRVTESHVGLAGEVASDLRTILRALTDPDPF